MQTQYPRTGCELAMSPNLVLGHMPAGIFLGSIAIELHGPGNGLNALHHLCPQLRVVTRIGKLVRPNLIDPGVRPVGADQDVLGRSKRLLRPVAKVDQVR